MVYIYMIYIIYIYTRIFTYMVYIYIYILADRLPVHKNRRIITASQRHCVFQNELFSTEHVNPSVVL